MRNLHGNLMGRIKVVHYEEPVYTVKNPITWEEELSGWPLHLRDHVKGNNRLNIGCGANQMPGWLNLDCNPDLKPDIIFNLDTPLFPFFPFPKAWFDVVFACHVLEHIVHLHELMAAIHHILIPGGRLVILSPYATSDDAFEDPHHVRLLNEKSWMYFDKRTYDNPGTHGTGATQNSPVKSWDQIGTWLIPYDEFKEDPELEFKSKHFRNVIREMHVVLRKREV
jgi:SAM-dependent methyltransferase